MIFNHPHYHPPHPITCEKWDGFSTLSTIKVNVTGDSLAYDVVNVSVMMPSQVNLYNGKVKVGVDKQLRTRTCPRMDFTNLIVTYDKS